MAKPRLTDADARSFGMWSAPLVEVTDKLAWIGKEAAGYVGCLDGRVEESEVNSEIAPLLAW
ncbi:hypothetical protein ED733_008591 [Metarhizium rileyi]|uniref:Uncharacterized protein n=1 Tax=Metarhizium rileyi (strain RCEF 4871) TaxID=1649241 RepID=A0A5C6GL88_METRR|nr:hypothetical protein ED733_008591 [Metarhizium rileyi]